MSYLHDIIIQLHKIGRKSHLFAQLCAKVSAKYSISMKVFITIQLKIPN